MEIQGRIADDGRAGERQRKGHLLANGRERRGVGIPGHDWAAAIRDGRNGTVGVHDGMIWSVRFG